VRELAWIKNAATVEQLINKLAQSTVAAATTPGIDMGKIEI